ncbi:circularly permuted type 2 ATP-grasp protein [Roseomonas xinghualingensis]|uniref:circularly permuted type 2 ATP-grasp protein n=1 Tax=Roseomonas xinghualingensis TaxID=2986475 RepID=UPI0021F1BC66|nr:circularly permuted type 2 ATP-grasp protein [Roseomonas sp. SXEYE001]MCV4208149.1 circularly permuted type 2 ATP-grasp protein [Roseomonas sp. SXEYE001]
MISPIDEMVDGSGRVRPHWRGLLGSLSSLPDGGLVERARLLDRAFEEEGSAGLLPSAGRGTARRLDPVPLVLNSREFAGLAEGLAQRARLLEAILADLYGPQVLLADGLIPPELVFANPAFLRPCRSTPAGRFLHSYAADLIRGPDGCWRVAADSVVAMDGLAQAMANRMHMARSMPESTRAVQMRPLRPFIESWRDVLQRATGDEVPGAAAVALLTPGVGHPSWAEHVTLARDLSCALAEAGDLTARGGALFLKTLRGLQPVRVLLSRIPGASLDPLELGGRPAGGVSGLLDAMRAGAVVLHNHPGAALVEAPALPAFLPDLCRALLDEALTLPSMETLWLGDPLSLERYLAVPGRHVLRPAAVAGVEAQAIGNDSRGFCASARPVPSLAPSLADGVLEPRPVTLRLFLQHDGEAWGCLPGGLARITDEAGRAGEVCKDIWVLSDERGEIRRPGMPHGPALSIRRAAGDLPSRVADNLFWLGRYVERLDDSARLMRATLARLERAPMLPRDLAEIGALSRCLLDAKLITREEVPTSGDDSGLRRALLRAGYEGGRLHRLTSDVARLVEATRDRLTGDMHAAFTVPLRDSRAALMEARTPAALGAALGGMVRYASGVAGVAAENMVRGGAHSFLDLGRRLERSASVAGLLGHLLEAEPARVESALVLALELCDSVITYRTRYLHVLQPGPALDLVMADPANPRGLVFQLSAAEALLAAVEGGDDPSLSAWARRLRMEGEAMAAEVAAASDGALAATALSARLLALEESVGALSDAIGRRYFTLVAAPRLLGVDTADALVRGAA